MTQEMTRARAKQAIDVLLEGKPSEFRAAVFQLCHQLDWADDEPSFLIAIATNQLEALVRQYPERISEAMRRAASELEADWKKLQAKLNLTALKSTQTATQITACLTDAQLLINKELSRTQQLLKDERSAMLQAMADERTEVQRLLTEERAEMAQQAEALAEHQKEVIAAHTKDLIAQAVVANQERADTQVKQIMNGVRWKHYIEVGAYAFGISTVLMGGVGWMAWTAAWESRGNAEASSTWGDLERWNQDHLRECVKAEQTTCNIHIEVPQE